MSAVNIRSNVYLIMVLREAAQFHSALFDENTQFHCADLDGVPKKSNKGIVFFHNFLQLLKNTLKMKLWLNNDSQNQPKTLLN
jgi:hypothetical protein